MFGPAIENCITLIVAGLTICGLYWMGAGSLSVIGLLFLLNLNTSTW